MADDIEDQVADALDDVKIRDGEGGSGSRLWIIVSAAVVLVGVAAGYGTAQLFRGSGSPPEALGQPVDEPQQEPEPKDGGDEFANYDFETITANLDEPRLSRYIRTTITLSLRSRNFEAAKKVIEKNQAELRSWLNTYFMGCTVDDVRGPKSINRLRREILDSLNERLWPGSKGLIEDVLIKDFVIQ